MAAKKKNLALTIAKALIDITVERQDVLDMLEDMSTSDFNEPTVAEAQTLIDADSIIYNAFIIEIEQHVERGIAAAQKELDKG